MDALRKVMIVLIMVFWSISMTLTFFDRTWDPPATVNALMLAAATALFAGPRIFKDYGAKPEKPDREEEDDVKGHRWGLPT